ncbi:MAG TPA: hypothetical protein PK867_09085 [Pirellulales bacterium]|nr:hypothetical protein [Pirellulales bacterium]
MTIAIVVAAMGGLVGGLVGLALLPLAAPLPEHRGWFVGLCAVLTASAAGIAAVVAGRVRMQRASGFARLLAGVLIGGAVGAIAAQRLYGYAPRGKQFLFFAVGAVGAASIMRLFRAVRAPAQDGSEKRPRGRWFQFTLGSLLAMTVIASAVLALWVRGPIKRRQVLATIERGGGGRVRYATVAPDWVVELLGDWVRGFFDEVDEIALFDATDADVAPLGVLPRVRSLTLTGGKVTDEAMKTVARLQALEELQLAGVFVTHKGLAELRRLPRLRSLVGPLGLDDRALQEIGALTNLASLWIDGGFALDYRLPASRQLAEELAHLRGLTQLEELAFTGMPVDDDDLAFLENLPRLKRLWLYNLNITDAALRHLRRLERLEELVLRETKVTGSDFQELRGLAQLRKLDLTCAPITDDGLRHLAAFTSLESLSLSQTKITDAGLPHLKPLKKLQSLNLMYTDVSDEGPTALEGLTNITAFMWYSSKITPARVERLENTWRERRAVSERHDSPTH